MIVIRRKGPEPAMRRLLMALSLLVCAGCATPLPSSPSSTRPPAPAAPPLTELHAYYEPREVYVPGAAQVHVGTFTRGADGSLQAVYDRACAFTTDGGEMTLPPAGVDTSWHVALITVGRAMGGRTVRVTATCDALSTAVAFYVAPDGAKPPQQPTPGNCTGPGCTGNPGGGGGAGVP